MSVQDMALLRTEEVDEDHFTDRRSIHSFARPASGNRPPSNVFDDV